MFRIIQKVYQYARAKHDDDCIARLNYSFTPKILFLLIIFIALKQFAGHPIQCWVSADLLIHWEGYIEKYCFVEGTYFVNQSEPMMPAKDAREGLKIKYYKWIPVFLCVQLVLFLAVKKFWSFSSESSGLDIYSIFGTCPLAPEAPKDNIKLVRIYVQRYQKILTYESKRIEKIWGCLSTTSYLTYLFLIYKVLALVNVGFQLWWMNHYFNTEYPLWGIGVLQNIYNKKDWIASGVFPRITFCDFIRRDETNSGPMSFPVQCVLMLNMFNEFIYIVLWFWFVILGFANLLSLFYWCIITTFAYFKRKFIRDLLLYAKIECHPNDLEHFLKTQLFTDGFFSIRIMSKNAGHLIASDIVAEMFQQYMKKKKEEAEKDFNGCTDILATVTDIDKEKMFDTIRSASDDSGYGNDDINDKHDEIGSGNSNESEHDYVQRIHDMFTKLDDQVANQLLLNYEDEKGERVLTIEDMNKFYLEKGPVIEQYFGRFSNELFQSPRDYFQTLYNSAPAAGEDNRYLDQQADNMDLIKMMQELNLFINPGTGEFLHPNDSAADSEVDKHVEPSLVHSYHQYASDPSAAAAALPYPNPFGRGAPQPYQQQPPQEQQQNPFLQPMNPKVDDILENLFDGNDLTDSFRKYMNLGSYEKDIVSTAAAAPSDSSLPGLPPTLNGYIEKFEAAINEPSAVGADKKINDSESVKVVPNIPPRVVVVADNKINDDSAMFETVQGPSKVVSDNNVNHPVALEPVQNTVTAAVGDKKINDIDPVKVVQNSPPDVVVGADNKAQGCTVISEIDCEHIDYPKALQSFLNLDKPKPTEAAPPKITEVVVSPPRNLNTVIEMPPLSEEMPLHEADALSNDEIFVSTTDLHNFDEAIPTSNLHNFDETIPISNLHNFDEVLSMPPSSNDEMPEAEQKPVNASEASIGLFGGGIYQDLKDTVNSIIGAFKTPSPTATATTNLMNENVVVPENDEIQIHIDSSTPADMPVAASDSDAKIVDSEDFIQNLGNDNVVVEDVPLVTKPDLQAYPELESVKIDKKANVQRVEPLITDNFYPETSEIPVIKNDADIDANFVKPMNADSEAASTVVADKNQEEKVENSFEAPSVVVEQEEALFPSTPSPTAATFENHLNSEAEIENAKINAQKAVDNFLSALTQKNYEAPKQVVAEVEENFEVVDENLLPPPMHDNQLFVPEGENNNDEIAADKPMDINDAAFVDKNYEALEIEIPEIENGFESANEYLPSPSSMNDYQSAPEAEMAVEQSLDTVSGNNTPIPEFSKLPEFVHEDVSPSPTLMYGNQSSVPEAENQYDEMVVEQPLDTIADNTMQIPEVEKIPESVEEDIILSSPLPSMHDYQPSVFPEAVEIIVEKPSDTFDTVGPWIQAIPEVEKIPESYVEKSSLPPSTPPMHDFQPSVPEAENISPEKPVDTVVDNTVPSFAGKYYEPQNQAIPEIEKSLESDEGILSPSSPSPPMPEYQLFVPEVENTEIIAEEPVEIVSDNILQSLADRYYGPLTSTIPKVEKNHESLDEDSIPLPSMYDHQTVPEAENGKVIAEEPIVTVAGNNMQIPEVEKIPESVHEDSSTTPLSNHDHQPSVFPEAVEVIAEKPFVTVVDDTAQIHEFEKDSEFIDEDIIPFAPSMYQSFAPEAENVTPEKPMDTVADNTSPIHEVEEYSESVDEGVISSSPLPPMHDYQPSVFPEAENVEIIVEMPMDTVADNKSPSFIDKYYGRWNPAPILENSEYAYEDIIPPPSPSMPDNNQTFVLPEAANTIVDLPVAVEHKIFAENPCAQQQPFDQHYANFDKNAKTVDAAAHEDIESIFDKVIDIKLLPPQSSSTDADNDALPPSSNPSNLNIIDGGADSDDENSINSFKLYNSKN